MTILSAAVQSFDVTITISCDTDRAMQPLGPDQERSIQEWLEQVAAVVQNNLAAAEPLADAVTMSMRGISYIPFGRPRKAKAV